MAKHDLLRRLFIAGIASGVVACTVVAGIDDLHIGECKGGHCERTDGNTPPIKEPETDSGPVSVVDGGSPCTGKPLPPAIRVGSGDNTFCIDTTEVSVSNYQEFLTANVSPSSQTGSCTWNKSFTPERTAAQIEAGVPANFPVTDVDWCDAIAYCEWAGKYLCGRVEKSHKVGAVEKDGLLNYQSHQWLLACSAEARLRYPYGGDYIAGRCNLRDLDAGGLVGVGTLSGCVGGFEGLHDMVGNAAEWFDGPCQSDGGLKDASAMEGAEGDSCSLKGAAYDEVGDQAAYGCAYDSPPVRRDHHAPNIGFRCCSD